MRLCREAEEEEERERLQEEEEEERWRMEEQRMVDGGEIVEDGTEITEGKQQGSEEAIFNVSTEPIERDMFEDSPDDQDNIKDEEEIALNSTNIVKQIDFEALDIKEEDDGFNDGFDDDLNDGQDSFLVAASQMVEDPVIKEELVDDQNDRKASTFKFPKESKPILPPAVSRLQQMGSDGFGSDDSFDEQMSQLPPGGFGTPASPVLKKRQRSAPDSSSRSPALSTRSKSSVSPPSGQPKPPIPACTTSSTPKGESIISPGPSFAALKPPPKPSLENQPKQHLVKPDLSKQTWKRFSSFDQTSQTSSGSSSGVSGNSSNISSTGSSFKRVKSSPVVSQVCKCLYFLNMLLKCYNCSYEVKMRSRGKGRRQWRNERRWAGGEKSLKRRRRGKGERKLRR